MEILIIPEGSLQWDNTTIYNVVNEMTSITTFIYVTSTIVYITLRDGN